MLKILIIVNELEYKQFQLINTWINLFKNTKILKTKHYKEITFQVTWIII